MAAALNATVLLERNGVLHHFFVDQPINTGYLATVSEGTELETGEQVAIKMRRSDRGSEAFKALFAREIDHEAACWAMLNGRPTEARGVGRLATAEGKSEPALVMDLVPGQPLGSPYDAGVAYGRHKGVRIGLKLLDEVARLHAKGFRHNDIHPGQVHLVNGVPESAKLLDYASATPTSHDTKNGGTFFTAPEMHSHKYSLSGRVTADLYSIGAVILRAITGAKNPCAASTFAAFEDITLQVGGRVTSLKAVLRKAVDPNPALRYQTAAELTQALRPFVY